MMLKLLRKFCKEGTFISMYTNQTDSDAFTFCKAVLVHDEFSVVLMEHPSGNFDGIQMLQNDLILRIETDDRYAEKMAILRQAHPWEEPDLSALAECTPEAMLRYLMENKRICSAEILDSGSQDVFGFVEGIEGDVCKLTMLDQYGYEDGTCYLPIPHLTRIAFGSEEHQILETLWNARQG